MMDGGNRRTYYDGLREGITMYAWWKDGKEYVGTTGTTLHRALAEINEIEARGESMGEYADRLGREKR
mgnify:CR=1 FL=1